MYTTVARELAHKAKVIYFIIYKRGKSNINVNIQATEVKDVNDNDK